MDVFHESNIQVMAVQKPRDERYIEDSYIGDGEQLGQWTVPYGEKIAQQKFILPWQLDMVRLHHPIQNGKRYGLFLESQQNFSEMKYSQNKIVFFLLKTAFTLSLYMRSKKVCYFCFQYYLQLYNNFSLSEHNS